MSGSDSTGSDSTGPPASTAPVRRIVVGVDGSEGSRAALRWSAMAASAWDAEVRAVHSWSFTPLVALTGGPTDIEEIREGVRHKLHRVLHDELGDADSTVVPVVVEDSPAEALLAEAAEADLVVVGSRGLGGFGGLLLGSVSQQVAHHAPCPVVIVPG